MKVYIHQNDAGDHLIDWGYTNASFADPDHMTEIPPELAKEFGDVYNKFKELSRKLGRLKDQQENFKPGL